MPGILLPITARDYYFTVTKCTLTLPWVPGYCALYAHKLCLFQSSFWGHITGILPVHGHVIVFIFSHEVHAHVLDAQVDD